MMPNTVATCTGSVPHISRMVVGPTATKVIHQLLQTVTFHRRHRRRQPQHPVNSVQETASYRTLAADRRS